MGTALIVGGVYVSLGWATHSRVAARYRLKNIESVLCITAPWLVWTLAAMYVIGEWGDKPSEF